MAYQEKHILVVSDDENSALVKRVGKKHYIPLIRKSTIAVIDLVKRHDIEAIIVDLMMRNFDPIEFVLNIRDINKKIPIYIPQQVIDKKNWDIVHRCGGQIFKFNNLNELIQSIN